MRPTPSLALAALLLCVPAAAAPDGLESRAFPFNDVGEFEEEPNASLGYVANHHVRSQALANEAGQVLILVLARHQLWGQRSTDGGATFGAPFTIESSRPVIGFAAYRSEDERVYLAYQIAGTTKDVGLRFRRSDDMGLNWTAPVDIVAEGDALHGVGTLWGLHANESGRVAVAFAEYWEATDTYVTVSSNFGASWSAPKKPDLDTVANRVPLECKVVVDPTGIVHVPYIQNRGSGARLFYSRSTDGGATFGGELAIGNGVANPGAQFGMDAGVTRQGRIVVATGDAGPGGLLRIFQSANSGVSFAQVSFWGNLGQPMTQSTRVVPSYATDTVLVGYVNDTGAIVTLRSTDQGATFAQPVNRTIGVGSARSFELGRTNDGAWVLLYERYPTGGDPYPNLLQASRSADDGVTFGAPDQIDHAGGTDQGETRVESLQTTNGLSGIVVLYRDLRSGTHYESYLARTTSGAFDFGAEQLVGPYGGVDNRIQPATSPSGGPIVVATDTAVHLLYRMVELGTRAEVFYARSTNGGDTYQTPVRIGQNPAGTKETVQIALAAHPTDPLRLYAVYARTTYDPLGYEILIRRSQDGGASWLAEQTITTTGLTPVEALRVTVTAADDLFVVYSSGTDLSMVISRDDGATWFLPSDFDQQVSAPSVINDQPVVCSSGTVVAVVWRSNQAGAGVQTVFARVSNNGGASFPSGVNLRSSLTASANVPDVECTGNEAFAVWADFRDAALTRAWGNRYVSGAWQTDRQVAPTQTRSQFVPRVSYTLDGATPTPLVVYTDNSQAFTNRSLDGGATWQAPVRLDDLAPQPIAASRNPYLVSDGAGNTWAVWQDGSAGQAAIAARHSGDGGTSWEGLVVRLNSEPNQGSRFTAWFGQLELPVAARGGTMHAVFHGQRSGAYRDVRVARWGATDSDADGVASAIDCNDADPTIGAAPGETSGLRVDKIAAVARVSWTSQDATSGTGTAYDVVSGDLAVLKSSGGYGAATCLVNGDADTPYDDSRAHPVPGAAYYYLVRGQHACTGTYGSSTRTPDPRDALDSGAPCP